MSDNTRTKDSSKNKYTLMGLLGVLIWGTGNAFGRSLAETYGNFSSNGLNNLGAGILSTVTQIKRSGIKSYKKAPLSYWLLCGPLYIIYRLTTNLSIGIAETREQVVTSGLIRLMWPLMTLIVAVIMFRDENRVSPWFSVSVAVCFVGIIVANTDAENFSVLHTLKVMFVDAFWPSVLSLISSVSWGLYSNLNRKIVGDEDYDAAGLFMIITGVLCFGATIFVDEPRQFSIQQLGELFYLVVLSGFIGTMFWNLSMQKGNHMLIIFVANFLPVFSTVFTSVMLGVKLTVPVIVGSVLVVAGTIWGKACIVAAPPKETARAESAER